MKKLVSGSSTRSEGPPIRSILGFRENSFTPGPLTRRHSRTLFLLGNQYRSRGLLAGGRGGDCRSHATAQQGEQFDEKGLIDIRDLAGNDQAPSTVG